MKLLITWPIFGVCINVPRLARKQNELTENETPISQVTSDLLTLYCAGACCRVVWET